MSASAGAASTFDLADGATFTLSDGSTVTVRDGELEMSDGRRLPMPAAGETITVERTVVRPDGGINKIKHTLRLSESVGDAAGEEPVAAAAAGGGENGEVEKKQNGTADPEEVKQDEEGEKPSEEGGESEAAEGDQPAAAQDTKPAAAEDEVQCLPEAASGEEEPIVPKQPVVMGLNCGNRSLKAMLWGSIPEQDEIPNTAKDEATNEPRGLLHPQHSILEVDEDDEVLEGDEGVKEALEASENANESFEFERKPAKADGGKEVESKEEDEPSPVAKVTVLAFDSPGEPVAAGEPPEESEESTSQSKESDAPHEGPQTPSTDDCGKQSPLEESSPPPPEDDSKPAEEDASQIARSPSEEHRRMLQRQRDHVKSSADLAVQMAEVIAATADMATDTVEAKPDAQPPASDNQPADAEKTSPTEDKTPPSEEAQSPERKTASTASPSSSDGTTPAPPRRDEVQHDLHLKLTPILQSLGSEPAGGDEPGQGQRQSRAPPSEDRKGTVPPNTPAVTDDLADPEVVSVPKVVSYYESITGSPLPERHSLDGSPRHLSPARSPCRRPKWAEPTETGPPTPPPKPQRKPASPSPERVNTVTPKVVNFAVPMQPQKVYISSQEPDEMESTPIPQRECLPPPPPRPEPARVVLVAVTADPLSAPPPPPADTPLKPESEQEREPEQKPESETVEVKTEVTSETEQKPEQKPQPETAELKAEQTEREPKPEPDEGKPSAPRTYDPALFEHEPKRPLVLTTEVTEVPPPAAAEGADGALPYDPVHDARTLPRGDATPVTEQPPAFSEPFDEHSDPNDPFLPQDPRPGVVSKKEGMVATCLDLLCCCWAP